MWTLVFDLFDEIVWTSWVAWGAGVLVTSLVLGSPLFYRRMRRRRWLSYASREEDLPWDALMGLLEKRNRDRAAAGLPPEEATPEEISQLLATLPDHGSRQSREDRDFAAGGGQERRTGGRRWGNPTSVRIRAVLWEDYVHGLVVNRSTGGLGIFVDRDIKLGTCLQVRAVEAPFYVQPVEAEVRHCRRVGKGYFLGCQFNGDVPWNTRVWFG
jgi:hypothetical protein